MSVSLFFPIRFVLTSSYENTELKASVKLRPSLHVSDEGIRLVPTWLLEVCPNTFVELYIHDSHEDAFFQDTVQFNGFIETAERIVKVLNIPKGCYQII